MLVASDGEPAGEGRVVKVWIGDTACPPDVTSAPTYDSAGLVALPWRPGVPVRLSREVTRDGEFTVYTLVIVPKGDGCFCVYEGCKKVRRPARGESVPFSFDLRRVESNLDLRLLGAEREPIPAAGVNKTILILREGRR